MKALCLIIDSEPPKESWRETYYCHRFYWNQALDKHPWVEGFFIRSTPELNQEYEISLRTRTLYARGEENWGTVLRKTQIAIGALLTDHDYVIRTNVSSIFDFHALARRHIESSVYSGSIVNDRYVTGSGMLLSRDVAQILTEPFEGELSGWDDADIAEILRTRDVLPSAGDAFIYDFSRGLEQLSNVSPGDFLHYRFRDYSDPIRFREREAKAAVFEKIYGAVE